jgi:hypothetical protein
MPFKGIGEILDKYLKKAFEKGSEQAADTDAMLEGWKKEVGILVAVLYRQNGSVRHILCVN